MKQFYCDGSLGSFRAGAAAIPISTSKMKTSYVANLEFQCINNIAEYEVMLLGSYLHGSCLDHHGMKLNIMLQPLIEELKDLWKESKHMMFSKGRNSTFEHIFVVIA